MRARKLERVDMNEKLLIVQSAYIDGEFIGYRLTTPSAEYDGLIFAGGKPLPGFRIADLGKGFTPGIGQTVEYRTVFEGRCEMTEEQAEWEGDMRQAEDDGRMT